MDRKRILKNTGQAKELPMDGPGVFISTLHGVEVNGIIDSMERIERYLENRNDAGRLSDNGFHLRMGRVKLSLQRKANFLPTGERD